MPAYTITFTLRSNVDLDMSHVLDGATDAIDAIINDIETVAAGYDWQRLTIDEGDVCVSEVEEVEAVEPFVEGDRLQLDVADHAAFALVKDIALVEVRFLRYLPGQEEALVDYSGLTLRMATRRLSMWSAQ
tara:strand:+ start:1218 stop:1610 length:393 start_codon:yes stop_codon:yes gene_type:complete